jgi:hypothetical protein
VCERRKSSYIGLFSEGSSCSPVNQLENGAVEAEIDGGGRRW